MKTNEAIQQVAEELGIPYETAHKAYSKAWEFIKTKMAELPLKEELTEEEFKALRPNFNIPEIGKFVATWDKYQRLRRRNEYVKKLKEKLKYDSENKGSTPIVQSIDSE